MHVAGADDASTAVNHDAKYTTTVVVTVAQAAVATNSAGIWATITVSDKLGGSTEASSREAPDAVSNPWRWYSVTTEPVYFACSAAMSALFYVVRPAGAAFAWIVRVLLYLPAKFIYLLFLERPFKAAISVFLWILPILSFIIVISVVGIIIGGMFGWLSAMLSSVLWPPVAEPQPVVQWMLLPTSSSYMVIYNPATGEEMTPIPDSKTKRAFPMRSMALAVERAALVCRMVDMIE
ncbi:hypothetical protein IWW54_002147 [Coemansia sp. RSA 2705]|nr:hypothetical protein IWW54_002147 [Coemansia sp. RSA 2705]